jgi:NAD dependent epimerase/dehydratase family enzyme
VHLGASANPGSSGAEAVNFTAPECVTQEQFSKTAAGTLGRPCFIPTPAWPMRLALGEQADLLLEGQRVAPHALVGQGFRFAFPTMETAMQDLYGKAA